MTDIDVDAEAEKLIAEMSEDEGHRFRWRIAIARERERWGSGEPCDKCGEWVGHFGGSTTRDPCPYIPLNVYLEEVRPNCMTVRRYQIGDAIRAACRD